MPQRGPRIAGGQRPRKRLSTLHRGDFCPRGHASGYWAAFRPLIRQAFARLSRTRPADQRQSPVLGPDDYPRPPECAAQRLPHARRRHPPPRANRRPGNAPQWGGMARNICLVDEGRQGLFSEEARTRRRTKHRDHGGRQIFAALKNRTPNASYCPPALAIERLRIKLSPASAG